MHVGIAARSPDKPVLQDLEKAHGVRRYACDASEPAAVELLFQNVVNEFVAPANLSQVRTNEIMFGSPWQLREFHELSPAHQYLPLERFMVGRARQ